MNNSAIGEKWPVWLRILRFLTKILSSFKFNKCNIYSLKMTRRTRKDEKTSQNEWFCLLHAWRDVIISDIGISMALYTEASKKDKIGQNSKWWQMKRVELIFVPSPGFGHLASTVEFAKRLIHHDHRIWVTVLCIKWFSSGFVDAYIEESLATLQPARIHFIQLPQVDPPSLHLLKSEPEVFIY